MGHSSMITEAYPELGWCNGKQGSGLPHPFRNETWAFFDSLWKEYRGVFADDQMNVGGEYVCAVAAASGAWVAVASYSSSQAPAAPVPPATRRCRR